MTATDQYQLYSDSVVRLAGAPTTDLARLGAPALLDGMVGILEIERALLRGREQASDALHALVGRADGKARAKLLTLRRNLYAGRTEAARSAAQVTLDPDVAALVDRQLALLTILAQRDACLAQDFVAATHAARTHLQSAAGEQFQRGLSLSSESLLVQLPKYLRADPRKLSAKQQQIERGVLRYLTRTAAKPTPFGALCVVVPGRLAACDRPVIAGSLRPRSRVRLNKGIFPLLWGHLSRRTGVRPHLQVVVNSTVRRDGEHLIFLAQLQRVEAFQRIAVSEPLQAVLGLVGRDAAQWTLSELIDAIARHESIETTVEGATAFVERMLEIGLLHLRTGVPDQDPDWDTRLVAQLAPLADPNAARVAHLLRDLRARSEAFAVQNARERPAVLAQMRQSLVDAMTELGVPVSRAAGFVCYEDTGADATVELPSSAEARAPLDALGRLIGMLQRTAWPMNEQVTMRHFFDTRYGAACQDVSLLTFYEDYYREHFKEHLARQHAAGHSAMQEASTGFDRANPFMLEVLARWSRANRQLTRIIGERMLAAVDADEVALSSEDVQAILGPLTQAADLPSSVSTFCHLIPPGPEQAYWRVVAPEIKATGGYGRYFSRFLYLFSPDVSERLRAANTALTDDLLVEIAGDANFNANLHPQLVDGLLEYPTQPAEHSDATRVSCADLVVQRAEEDAHRLVLAHRETGRRVWPIDLGFLNSRLRPALYQLLLRFQPPSAVTLTIPGQHLATALAWRGVRTALATGWSKREAQCCTRANDGALSPLASSADRGEDVAGLPDESRRGGAQPARADEGSVRYFPRVVFDGSVVLSRRRWVVRSADLPRRGDRTDYAYFLDIQRWRLAYGIPDRVFVRAQTQHAGSSIFGARHGSATPDGEDMSTTAAARRPDDECTPPKATILANGPSRNGHRAAKAEHGVHVAALPETRSAPTASAERIRRDDGKPQYIDFSSPLLVGRS